MARTSKSVLRRHTYQHIKRTKTTRSGLEAQVRAQLEKVGDFKDERQIEAIFFTNPILRRYHPDFQLPNGIYIESKGWFKPADRTKHLLVKSQNPELDIRFVFSNPDNRLSKTSRMTYAGWCDKHGFLYSKGTVPQSWIDERK